jgi:hypothetical protein
LGVCGVDWLVAGAWFLGGDGRRPRSRGQGGPEATPKGLGLDAGEERRTLITPDRVPSAPGVGWGSVQRTVVLDLRGVAAARLPGIPSPTGG